jgi:hypothetical protein
MAAAFRLLANAFEMMRGRPTDDASGSGDSDVLANMIEVLRQNADDPPTELKGVPDSFLDELERVPKSALRAEDTCPICVNPFLEGRHVQHKYKVLANMIMRQTNTRLSCNCPATKTIGSTWTAYDPGSN